MANIKFYKASALPGTPSAGDDGLWFVKPSGSNPMKIYLIHNGGVVDLDAVDAATLSSALALKADDNAVVKLSGTQTVGGAKTFSTVPKSSQNASSASDLVRKSQMDSELSDKADDSAVVKLTGNQTVGGAKTFSTVPKSSQNASASNDLMRKSQIDALLSSVNDAINDLETAVNAGMRAPLDIDCSSNPNYPSADAGDTWIVTAGGKIGGASGIDVQQGDMIVCKTDNAGGTHATVGDSFFVVESNLQEASTTIKGYIRVATTAEVNNGSSVNAAVRPDDLQTRLEALETSILSTAQTDGDDRYVRYDTASQGLTGTQKQNARTNIDAPSDGEVVKTSGTQTVAGAKTFSTVPKSSQDASGNTDLVRKSQFDSGLATKANDNAVVKLTGTQTVGGAKTFSTVPKSSQDASSSNDLVRKSQLDTAIDNVELEWTVDDWQ